MFKDCYGNRFPNEKKLHMRHGRCRPLQLCDCVFISDTHGGLWEREEALARVKGMSCILLGDHEFEDIDIVLEYFPRVWGVLGNHDLDWATKYGIENIHGRVIELNGVKILGCGGSYRYKEGRYPCFTQEEAREFFEDMPPADILVSHDSGYDESKSSPRGEGEIHMGLYGITEYLFSKRIPFHVHGHNHEKYIYRYLNGTTELSIKKNEIYLMKGNK